MDFAVPADHGVKLKENESKNKYLDFARELKKNVEHESDGDANYKWCSWYSHQRIGNGTGGLGNDRIVGIGQNTEESPGDLKKLAIT